MESVRCRLYGPTRYFYLGVLSLMSLVGVPVLISSIVGADGPPIWFAALWIGILLWNWFVILWLFAYEIRLLPEGTLTFKAVLREVTMNAGDVLSISTLWWDLNGNVLVFRTPSRKMRTLRSMDGLFSLIEQLRLANPSLETRGL